MTDPTPSDYESHDGYDEQQGVEQCPHCGILYSGNGGYTGTVYDKSGRKYEHFYDTEPEDIPFFCPDCWDELETNRKQQENATLGGFTE